MLLTADFHLTDALADDYRWEVFSSILLHAPKDGRVCILGDLCDRKDRHSAQLVNRIVDNLLRLTRAGLVVDILRGNHDAPLTGDAFWEFLSKLAPGRAKTSIRFHSEPKPDEGFWLLPWTAKPNDDWNTLNFNGYKCLLMHQPVNGATADNGHVLRIDDKLPIFPRGMRIYSGDIHTPQKINRVQYVGAPHPVKFGDSYRCRMLQLDAGFDIAEEIELHPPRKAILTAASIGDLRQSGLQAGDQVRIRMTIATDRLGEWTKEQDAIREWANKNGITVASVEAVLPEQERADVLGDYLAQPADALRDFCAAEGIDEPLLNTGLAYLEKLK